ncbi:hypothetical protein CRG98_013368 [Punica granatum]|uniref:Uncharacterized protein n=1 Tax=Punica granatum TaxID=22663 RepID=A0A2I0KD87_PUNGR|nr:hypothetical protein CRG98_013368 [Punica granatum]
MATGNSADVALSRELEFRVHKWNDNLRAYDVIRGSFFEWQGTFCFPLMHRCEYNIEAREVGYGSGPDLSSYKARSLSTTSTSVVYFIDFITAACEGRVTIAH